MTNIRSTARNVFVWAYGRGTIQYDIICALILAFIFLVPPSCFIARRTDKARVARPPVSSAPQGANTDLRR
jgi:hypothetical protein